MRFENRKWIFLPTSAVTDVNFDQVMENSSGTLRYSLDESTFFVKYETTTSGESVLGRPDCYDQAINISGSKELNHAQVLEYLSGPDWNDPNLAP